MKILNKKGLVLICVGVACIILLVITSGADRDKAVEHHDYELQLENKLTDLISLLAGTDDVKVMVTLESGVEHVYAVDSESSPDHQKDAYYSAGEEDALLLKDVYPVVKGVAVVLRGRGTVNEATVTDLLSRVLDLPLRCIFVEIK